MQIPDFVLENTGTFSSRKFKSLKRKQLRIVSKAVDNLRAGCAYFPNGLNNIEIITEHVERIKYDISVKNWGN